MLKVVKIVTKTTWSKFFSETLLKALHKTSIVISTLFLNT